MHDGSPLLPVVTRRRRAVARRGLLLVAGVAALVGVATWDPVHGAFVHVVDATAPLLAERPMAGPALFAGLAALSALAAFLSSTALVPVALEAWGPTATAALLWTGWMVGGAGTYALGRWPGHWALTRLDRRGSLRESLGRVRPDLPLPVVVVIHLALQSELAGVVLGAARYPFGRYLAALAIAEGVWTGLAVAAGVGLADQSVGALLVVGGLVGVASVGALVYLHRQLPRFGPAAGAPRATDTPDGTGTGVAPAARQREISEASRSHGS